MKHGKASKTAEAVAAVRARHYLRDDPRVFSDPWALSLTSPAWRTICQSRWLSWIVFDNILAALRPVQANLLCRARYTEDTLGMAVTNDITDYVIVGAGLDSFALRQSSLAHPLRIWEVDHPDTQLHKLVRLKKLDVAIPPNVTFVAADLAVDSLYSALLSRGFDSRSISLVSMLGLSYYLPEKDVFSLMKSIGTHFSSGSELVMDIRVDRRFVDPMYLSAFDRAERFTARRGEPMLNEFDPTDFIRRARLAGLVCVEHLTSDDQRDRYCSGRKDELEPSPMFHLLRFRVY